MTTRPKSVTRALYAEIEKVPEDRRPLLLRLVHSFREGVEQEIEEVNPRDSLRQALREAKGRKTRPIKRLWSRVIL
jgi:hypothetical protein